MWRDLRRNDSGQALAIAAGGAFLLAIALSVTIDWGYALLQRRIAQNEADKVALEVGRMLATSVDTYGRPRSRRRIDVRTRFEMTQEEACELARDVHLRDRRPTPQALAPDTLKLTFETPSTRQVVDCANARDDLIPDRTWSVLARVEMRYRSLVASILRQPSITVGASARAAIIGSPFTADPVSSGDDAQRARSATAIVRTWPISRFFKPADFNTALDPCGPLCDPTDSVALAFTGAGSEGLQVLDFSRDSSYRPATIPVGRTDPVQQLLTDWDRRGVLVDRAGGCGGSWNTAGGEAIRSICSVPNWFEQPLLSGPLAGAISLEAEWDHDRALTRGQAEAPELDDDRAACTTARTSMPWLPTSPSCRDEQAGDWIETTDRPLMDFVASMREFIREAGSENPFSRTLVARGPNADGVTTYGKAVVVWVYLWDCGQRFDGREWDEDDTVCPRPDLAFSYPGGAPQRVHVFSVMPFTFYEGLVTPVAAEGFWGGSFTDPGRCETDPASCLGANPLANSVFLVPDDRPWDPDP